MLTCFRVALKKLRLIYVELNIFFYLAILYTYLKSILNTVILNV